MARSVLTALLALSAFCTVLPSAAAEDARIETAVLGDLRIGMPYADAKSVLLRQYPQADLRQYLPFENNQALHLRFEPAFEGKSALLLLFKDDKLERAHVYFASVWPEASSALRKRLGRPKKEIGGAMLGWFDGRTRFKVYEKSSASEASLHGLPPGTPRFVKGILEARHAAGSRTERDWWMV